MVSELDTTGLLGYTYIYNKDKTIINVRGSTNGISNKYIPYSFYYSTGNHTQRRFQSDDFSLMNHFKLLTWSY